METKEFRSKISKINKLREKTEKIPGWAGFLALVVAPGVAAIAIPAAASWGAVAAFFGAIMLFYAAVAAAGMAVIQGLPGVVTALAAPLLSNDGFIAVPGFARSGHDSNAPPAGPPSNSQLPAWLPFYVSQQLDILSETTENILKNSRVSEYVATKIVEKFTRHLDLIPAFDAQNPCDFKRLAAVIRKETGRLVKNIFRQNSGGGEAEIRAAREELTRREYSIDAALPGNGGAETRSFHDVLPCRGQEPLEILISRETEAENAAILAGLGDSEKAELFKKYDDLRRRETGELFELPDDGDGDGADPAEKPANTLKYRRKPAQGEPAALGLFGGVQP